MHSQYTHALTIFFIHSGIPPSTHQSNHPFNNLSTHQYDHSIKKVTILLYQSICLFIHRYTHQLIIPFIQSQIHSSIHQYIHPLTNPITHFVNPLTNTLTHSPICFLKNHQISIHSPICASQSCS